MAASTTNKSSDDWHCYYCSFHSLYAENIIHHSHTMHGYELLRLKMRTSHPTTGAILLQTKNYGFIPNHKLLAGETLKLDPDSLDVEIINESLENSFGSMSIASSEDLQPNTISNDEPLIKKIKLSTFSESTDMGGVDLETYALQQEMKEILPKVVLKLKQEGHLESWVKLNRLIYEDRFPFENIAFQLFMDVCRFFDSPNTSAMKYSETVKRFWRIGYRLFHGKWLKFMGGPKHQGSLISKTSNRGIYAPSEGLINFAVPNRSVLSSECNPIPAHEVQPGVMMPLLDKMGKDVSESKTYKLCVDGKKINSSRNGKLGDIDLWGFEQAPTLAQRRELFTNDSEIIKHTVSYVQTQIDKHKACADEMQDHQKDALRELLIQTVRMLSLRVRELRETLLRKEMAKDKIMKSIEGDWKQSKMVFVISALSTSIYDIRSSIKNTLGIIEDICEAVANISNVKYDKSTVDLSAQSNYMHLTGVDIDITDARQFRYVKQRGNQWFEIRKKAKVTGSTLYSALGLDTLKKQQQHFDEVVFAKAKPMFSENIQERLQYGTSNEVNGLATFVGKILPVLHPRMTCFEEGCYKVEIEGVKLVVSPDGSCRSSMECKAEFGLEIKCPFPGKSFTTSVFYTMPKYYVTQVLAEMKALETDTLYFVCYSPESTTVHKATFDDDIWNDLQEEIVHVYSGEKPTRPSQRSQRSKFIQQKLKTYIQEKVQFILEVPSVKGRECTRHTMTDSNIFCFSDNSLEIDVVVPLEQIIEMLHNANIQLETAYRLTRTRASEFLGFVISDVDREYRPEGLYTVPIAYGLKGPSMPTATLRKMIEHVLYKCKQRGLYVPVCSFDGQWCRLAVRDGNDKPLTVHQLQKDVYAEMKNMSKIEMIRDMCSRNSVALSKHADYNDVCQTVNIEITKNPRQILVHGHKCHNSLEMSKHSFNLLKQKTVNKIVTDVAVESNIDSCLENDVFSSIPDKMLEKMTDDVIEDVGRIATDHEKSNEHHISNSSDRFFEPSVFENSNDTCDENPSESNPKTILKETVPGMIDEEDLKYMLESLQSDQTLNGKGKWNIAFDGFVSLFATAEKMKKSFLLKELGICLKHVIGKLKSNGIKICISSPKHVIVNTLSMLLGDKSQIKPSATKVKKRTVQSLKALAKLALHKVSKEHLNVIMAENQFPTELRKWYDSSPFGKVLKITGIDCSQLKTWFSRPEYNAAAQYFVFMILDGYHQLCGLRRLFCAKGIPAAGFSNKAIYRVAEESDVNQCGLTTAHVKDLIDRQNVGYAVQTFSFKVEKALNEIGATREANFCRLVRDWYTAEDEPGISAVERCRYRLNLREWLLETVNFGKFPPCGAYIKDIPVILYEGLLTGIERKIQLYPFTKSGSYNVRSVGSLDIENFFGSFQDIDPRGTGVLRPDDIPTAISIAMELCEARMDPERGFHMVTSNAKVYPSYTYHEVEGDSEVIAPLPTVRDVSHIQLRDHSFDQISRQRGKRKRKRGDVTHPDEPVRRPLPVREFHKAHESKILPHVRRGLTLNNN